MNSSSAIPREGLKRLYNHLVVNLVIAFGGEASMLLLGRIGRGNVAAVIFFAGAVGATLNTYYRLSKLAAIPASELNLDPIDEKLTFGGWYPDNSHVRAVFQRPRGGSSVPEVQKRGGAS